MIQVRLGFITFGSWLNEVVMEGNIEKWIVCFSDGNVEC